MRPPDDERDFLGSGWRFPLQVTSTGGIALARREQRVEESIYLILSTAPGERVMLPDFGCPINDSVFAPSGPTTSSIVVERVRRALVAYEPRIDVLGVTADTSPQQPNLLLVRIDYRIRSNNALGNLVYPLLLEEAG